MHISIIIPSYNNFLLISKCILSILKFDSIVTHEIIIADNASSKDTSQYLQYLQKTTPIRIIFNQSNLGFAKACNQGAKIANGNHLIFLNNDTEVTHGWVEELTRCILADPRIGVVGCKLLYPDNTIQHAGVAFSSVKVHHLYRNFHPEHPATNTSRQLQAVTGACMLVPRKLFLFLGGFDEAFINGFEDLDFCFRARSKGFKVVYTPKSVVIHHESKTPGRHDHHAHNARLFASRWQHSIIHDLDEIYAKDGLMRLVEFENECGGKWLADTNANRFWDQAKSLAKAGDYIEAEKLYGQALAFNPYDVRRLAIAEELADVYMNWGRFSDAAACLDAIIQVRPSKGALEKKAQITTAGRFTPGGPAQT